MVSAFKHCPSCGAEYQAWATWCHDCDVSLDVPSPPGTARDGADDDAGDAAGLDDVHLLREGPVDWLDRLGDALATAGIESWIRSGAPTCGQDHRHAASCTTRVGLWVRGADLPRAAALDAVHARVELPELPEDALPADCCPACEAPCPPEARACEACGLEFGE